MSSIPENLYYTRSHEWVRVEANGEVTVGITEHAQHLLGDLVYVELPAAKTFETMQEAAVVESVKAASDVYAPIAGTVTTVNDALNSDPGLVNREPYTGGWLFKMKPVDATVVNQLLTAAAYRDHIG